MFSELSISGIIFFTTAWICVTSLTAYCIIKVLRTGNSLKEEE